MGVYFGATEITGMHFGEQEITEIFFGNTEIFTVWAEYDGTLPAQYSANGDYLADYRIYGSAGGVGDRAENLFDVNNNIGITDNAYINQQGAVVSNVSYYISGFIPVQPNSAYGWTFLIGSGTYHSSPTVAFYDSNKAQIAAVPHAPVVRYFNFTTPQDCEYVRASIYKVNKNTAMLTEGSTAPTSYIPYGYEVDMSVRSVNLCFKTITSTNIDASGNITNNASYAVEVFEIVQGKTYTIKCSAQAVVYAMYAQEPMGAGSHSYDGNRIVVTAYTETFVAPINGYCAVRRGINADKTIAVDGSVAPNNYQSYSNTTTPIYIGSSPLGEDEYVDYGAGKIYRMSGGVLTPTDPPVPLPVLPTIDGTNIVDYAGQSAAVPSKFTAKYRKEGF